MGIEALTVSFHDGRLGRQAGPVDARRLVPLKTDWRRCHVEKKKETVKT
jgi:hypothetical protein